MASFDDQDLTGTEFRECVLDQARMIGVVMRGAVIDGDIADLVVNGVEVTTYVEAELDRRFPGRGERRSTDPDGLRGAWAALERTWAATLERAAAMPEGTVETSVDGEWSFSQTLRHLVLVTDMWLGRAVLGLEQPYHPLGLPAGAGPQPGATAGASPPPPYDAVLEARAGRVALVRDFLAGLTPADLAAPRRNPHDPARSETTLFCLHVILGDEWEHQRFAVRDLDRIDADTRASSR